MFHQRSSGFDPRISVIADHLRAIEKELGGLGIVAGRRASAGAAAAGNQIADVLGPLLSEALDRFRRGQRVAVDEAASMGNEAVRIGTRVGSDALERIAAQAKHRPLLTLAVAIGVGILIETTTRRR